MKREELAFLLDLKALMEHAIFHLQGGSRIDMHLAINHAHQAVELTLRRKADLLGKNPRDFPALIETLQKAGVRIPYSRQIDELNKARVLSQHYSSTPSDNNVRRLVFVAKDFLTDFWKDALDADYDSVSLTELISNDDIRNVLKEAEKADNPEECVMKSVLATYMVKWWIESGFSEEWMSANTITGDIVGVEEALDFVLDIALSSPFAYKLKKLREHTGIVFLPIPEGKPVMQRMKQTKFSRENANQAFELAIEYALWAEHIYG
jgi:HEPN domain-containing protein